MKKICIYNKKQKSLKYILLLFLGIFLIPVTFNSSVYAQSYIVKIMGYNVFNYQTSTPDSIKTDLFNVINPIDPDILIGVEIDNQSAANDFRDNVLNSSEPGKYAVGTSPPSSASGGYDNYIFYRDGMFNTPTAAIVVESGKWPTYKFEIEHISSSNNIIIYGAHLTSGAQQPQREAEANAIRSSTAGLGESYFIAVGDFNLVSSSGENAYSILTDNGTSNYLIDPGAFTSSYNTFSTKNTFDKRYDFIFNSTSVTSSGLVDYNSGSFEVIGNSGGSTSSPYTVASDHLPVYAEYTFNSAVPVELISFTGVLNGERIDLNWRTETEVNNYGFEIERSKDKTDWRTIGFVEGNGNSNSPKRYNFTDSDISKSGSYFYRLKQIDSDGTFEYSEVIDVEVNIPVSFMLSQNYPNPFNPETKIDYTMPQKQQVNLRIYSALGEMVKELVNEQQEAGSYSVTFDASNLPSGAYIYRLQTSEFVKNMKMLLIK
jgi:hypothetical protein